MTKTTIIQIIPATVATFAHYRSESGTTAAPVLAWALVSIESDNSGPVQVLKGLTALNTEPGCFADSHPHFQKYIHSTQLGLNHYIRYHSGLLPSRAESVNTI